MKSHGVWGCCVLRIVRSVVVVLHNSYFYYSPLQYLIVIKSRLDPTKGIHAKIVIVHLLGLSQHSSIQRVRGYHYGR